MTTHTQSLGRVERQQNSIYSKISFLRISLLQALTLFSLCGNGDFWFVTSLSSQSIVSARAPSQCLSHMRAVTYLNFLVKTYVSLLVKYVRTVYDFKFSNYTRLAVNSSDYPPLDEYN